MSPRAKGSTAKKQGSASSGGGAAAVGASSTFVGSPQPNDILCGKDQTYNKFHGNKIFKTMILEYREAYSMTLNKNDKMRITKQIVQALQTTHGSRFIKKNKEGVWHELTDQKARDKVSHALRFSHSATNPTPPPLTTNLDDDDVVAAEDSSSSLSSVPSTPTSIKRIRRPSGLNLSLHHNKGSRSVGSDRRVVTPRSPRKPLRRHSANLTTSKVPAEIPNPKPSNEESLLEEQMTIIPAPPNFAPLEITDSTTTIKPISSSIFVSIEPLDEEDEEEKVDEGTLAPEFFEEEGETGHGLGLDELLHDSFVEEDWELCKSMPALPALDCTWPFEEHANAEDLTELSDD